MADHIVHLEEESFVKELAKGVTLVDFYADWCGPCKIMVPVMEELALEIEGKARVAKINVDNAQEVSSIHNVTSIPTIILFKDGQEVDRMVGVRDKQALLTLLNKAF